MTLKKSDVFFLELLETENDEEYIEESIEETESIIDNVSDCGCCSECMCNEETECINCSCECYGDYIDYEYNEDDEEEVEYSKVVPEFNINIIKKEDEEKRTKITLELNVILDNKKGAISIDMDIKNKTYFRIIKELIKN